jgi:hypothetical protein
MSGYYTTIARQLLSEIDGIIQEVKSPNLVNTSTIENDIVSLRNTVNATQKRFLEEVEQFDGAPIMVPISKMDNQLQKLRNLNARRIQANRNLENQKKKSQNEINRIKAMSNIELKKRNILALINGLKRNIGNNNRN